MGASRATLRLLAKRPVQSAKIHRLNNRLREQARSHKNASDPAYLYQAKNTPCAFALVKLSQCCTQTCGSEPGDASLAREEAGAIGKYSSPEQSPSRASSLPQERGRPCISEEQAMRFCTG
ncbi:hypothetical protein DND58_23890 [Pseudomonas syringae pv. pisi]|nr:hypothetical protein DND62_28305 [Pseudomonas syringae pv. pisi]PYD26388.1 hypothetical protein DND58_23890 [Pseudomonas syringae pv. pisi]